LLKVKGYPPGPRNFEKRNPIHLKNVGGTAAENFLRNYYDFFGKDAKFEGKRQNSEDF